MEPSITPSFCGKVKSFVTKTKKSMNKLISKNEIFFHLRKIEISKNKVKTFHNGIRIKLVLVMSSKFEVEIYNGSEVTTYVPQ